MAFESVKEAAAYLAALIDGEGCIHHNKKGTNQRSVHITNTDPDILDAAEEALRMLELPYGRYPIYVRHGNRKACWNVRILKGKTSFPRLLKLVPLQARRKLTTLQEIVASYQEVIPIPAKDILYEEYILKDRTGISIAKKFGVSTRTVYGWLSRAGVPRRNKSIAGQRRYRKQP